MTTCSARLGHVRPANFAAYCPPRIPRMAVDAGALCAVPNGTALSAACLAPVRGMPLQRDEVQRGTRGVTRYGPQSHDSVGGSPATESAPVTAHRGADRHSATAAVAADVLVARACVLRAVCPARTARVDSYTGAVSVGKGSVSQPRKSKAADAIFRYGGGAK